jgi:excisionase family DNA binding protein
MRKEAKMVAETEDTRLVYSVGEVAKLLHISRNLAYELARKRELPGVIFMGVRRMVVSKAAIDKLLAEGSLERGQNDNVS